MGAADVIYLAPSKLDQSKPVLSQRRSRSLFPSVGSFLSPQPYRYVSRLNKEDLCVQC